MPDAIVSIAAACLILLVVGLVLGSADRSNFRFRWLIVAIALVLINDAALTRLYGLIPSLPESDWNWVGKTIAIIVSLMIAALPAFGFKRCGLTLRQKAGSWVAAIPTMAIYCLFFLGLAIIFPSEPASAETIAFQLSMPGVEEELFFRGILLFALNEAFRGRVRFLGIDWGWAALLSSMMFGLTHAFGYQDGAFSFDPMYMALTAFPSLLAVWLRERTGSLVLPILIHNFGNSIGLLVRP